MLSNQPDLPFTLYNPYARRRDDRQDKLNRLHEQRLICNKGLELFRPTLLVKSGHRRVQLPGDIDSAIIVHPVDPRPCSQTALKASGDLTLLHLNYYQEPRSAEVS